MRLTTKYILTELIGPFLFGLAVITFVLIMDFILDILNLIISKGLDWKTILEVFALNLAWMLALSVPMSVLVAALMAFGRMSADNEITALNACGVPLYRIVAPALLASAVLASGLVWFNNEILPEANHQARLLMTDITQKKPAWNLEPNVFIDYFEGYHLLVKKVDPRTSKLEDVTIYDHREGALPRTIIAKRGRMEFSADGTNLHLFLEEGEIHEPDEEDPTHYRRLSFNRQTINIADVGGELVRSYSDYRGDREKSSSQMLEENRQKKAALNRSRRKIQDYVGTATSSALAGDIGRTESPPRAFVVNHRRAATLALKDNRNLLRKIEYEATQMRNLSRQINSLNVEVHKKYSIPVACLVFILIGAPLGVMARRGGMSTGLGLSLLFFILYWAFLIGGEELADRQFLSAFWAMWSANFLIGAVGIILLVRSVRETVFISWEWLDRLVSRFRKSTSEDSGRA
jgi:lipopolysaccharide export system permease protein